MSEKPNNINPRSVDFTVKEGGDKTAIKDVRCPKCSKKLCETKGETNLKVVCPRCKTLYIYPAKSSFQEKLQHNLTKK